MRLKVHSCKLYNNKCMVASIQITNTELFAFIAALVYFIEQKSFVFKKKSQ